MKTARNNICFIFIGFMTNQEKELFQVVPCNEFNTYWIPCTWFVYRIQEAAKKGKLLNDYAIETIMRVRVMGPYIRRCTVWRLVTYFHELLTIAFTFIGILRVSIKMWTSLVLWLGFYSYGIHTGNIFHIFFIIHYIRSEWLRTISFCWNLKLLHKIYLNRCF